MTFLCGQQGSGANWTPPTVLASTGFASGAPNVVSVTNSFNTNNYVNFTSSGTLPTGVSGTYQCTASTGSTATFSGMSYTNGTGSGTITLQPVSFTGSGSQTMWCSAGYVPVVAGIATAINMKVYSTGASYLTAAICTLSGSTMTPVAGGNGSAVAATTGLVSIPCSGASLNTSTTYYLLACWSGSSTNFYGTQAVSNSCYYMGNATATGGTSGSSTQIISGGFSTTSELSGTSAQEFIIYATGTTTQLPPWMLNAAQDLSFLGRH